MLKMDIKQTKFTPSLLLDIRDDRAIFEVKGDSLPENTVHFYKPLMETTRTYLQQPKFLTIINMELTYFNSSSSKLFFDFFDLLEEANNRCSIVINWIYDKENESMQEAGEDYKDDFELLNFNLVIK